MKAAISLALSALASGAFAAPVTYEIEPNHTAPAIETDHLGGLSIIRGKFTKNSGNVVLDKQAGTGTVEVVIDTSSIDLGHPKLEEEVRKEEMLDVKKYPTATYKGKLVNFKNGAPTEVHGTLTLHGVTKPVNLKINQFLCKPHPMFKREVCGADASGTFNRDEFGISVGKDYGFKQDVKLLISIEAVEAAPRAS
jgi:polyisoprenoid-binding protein YceI